MADVKVAKWNGPRGKDMAPGPLSPATAKTAERLELELDGRVPPCRWPHAHLWTSEDWGDLHTAASVCRSICPALDACLTHTETLKPAWGAWTHGGPRTAWPPAKQR